MDKKSKHHLPLRQVKCLFYSTFLMTVLLFGQSNRDKMDDAFAERCWDCHDEDMKKGGIQLDDPSLWSPETLDKAFRAVRGGNMPPAKKKQLTPDLKAQLLSSISKELSPHKHHQAHMRRMTKNELIFSLEDIFGIDLRQHIKDKISDEQTQHGFDVASDLGLSDQHLNIYLSVISDALNQAFEQHRVEVKNHTSPKFRYDAHAKRKRIEIDGPTTTISTQPRTANGTSFPYFREGFMCEHEGWYEVEFECEPIDSSSTVMMFAGTYYIDGALVFNRPRLLNNFYIDKKQTIKTKVYLRPKEEVAFSALHGTTFSMSNPVTLKGPILDEWPSREVKNHLKGIKVNYTPDEYQIKSANLKDLKESLFRFAKKVFRKPMSKDELAPYIDSAVETFNEGNTWLESLKIGMSAMLCSSDFLIINSDHSESYRVASQLASMFWKSIPDSRLLNMAQQEKLTKHDIIKNEFNRMQNSPKFKRFITDFCNQWMNFKELQSISADYRLYPEYDIYLRDSMIEETILTFTHYIENNRSLKDMIESDYIFVNEKLAQHYQIPNVKGTHFRKVKLDKASSRGGLMTQASLMMSTADGAATTPVKRGLWVLENFLNKYVPAPPKNIPGIEPDIQGKRTILEQLAVHRDRKDCRSCHTVIDAYGVAFENFDPLGQDRDFYRVLNNKSGGTITFSYKKNRFSQGENVVDDYDMPNGDNYKGIQGFKQKVQEESHRVYTNLAEKLLSYAKGRHLSYQEQLESDQLGMEAFHQNMGMKDFMIMLISSKLFREAS